MKNTSLSDRVSRSDEHSTVAARIAALLKDAPADLLVSVADPHGIMGNDLPVSREANEKRRQYRNRISALAISLRREFGLDGFDGVVFVAAIKRHPAVEHGMRVAAGITSKEG